MTLEQRIITIAMVSLGTLITRFLPFIAFPAGKPTPKYVKYLGKVLPAAALGMLVMYCMKDISIFAGNRGIPEFIGTAAVIILHCLKRNMLLSIAGGTAVYMLLIQFVF